MHFHPLAIIARAKNFALSGLHSVNFSGKISHCVCIRIMNASTYLYNVESLLKKIYIFSYFDISYHKIVAGFGSFPPKLKRSWNTQKYIFSAQNYVVYGPKKGFQTK